MLFGVRALSVSLSGYYSSLGCTLFLVYFFLKFGQWVTQNLDAVCMQLRALPTNKSSSAWTLTAHVVDKAVFVDSLFVQNLVNLVLVGLYLFAMSIWTENSE